jgi:hypothetical protein
MVSEAGLRSLYEQVLHCETRNIPGAYVECGVWKGGATGMMALANLQHGEARRQLHLFDSFQEICEPDARVDGERAVRETQEWSKGGTFGRLVPLQGFYDAFGGPGTIAENRDLLEQQIGYDPAFVRYHEGWFQETIPRDHADIGPVAILRLDSDWYASTRICLEFLFDKVVAGGFVIIDDYGTYDGCRLAVDEFLSNRRLPLLLNRVNQDIHYLIIP